MLMNTSMSSISSQECSYKKTIESLLKQNKMKEAALQKATNLIKLLSHELQSIKIQKQELEQQIRTNYESKIEEMFDKMQLLQEELGRVKTKTVQSDVSNEAKMPSVQNLFMNFQENLSPTIKKNRSTIRTYSKEDSICSKQTQKGLNVDKQIIKDYVVQNEQWKNDVLDTINTLVYEQQKQLTYIKQSKQYKSELSDTFDPLPECLTSQKIQKLQVVIEEQQKMIIEMKKYFSLAEQTYKECIFRLQQTLQRKHSLEPLSFLQVNQALLQTKLRLLRQKRQWDGTKSELLVQNIQLKNIAERMIVLYKSERQHDHTQLLY